MKTIAVCATVIVVFVIICSTAITIARKVVEGAVQAALVENVSRETADAICVYAFGEVTGNGKGN